MADPTIDELSRQFLAEAEAFISSRYPGALAGGGTVASHHDDSVDAFRHAYIFGRFAHVYGGAKAFMIGWALEVQQQSAPGPRQMDLFNDSRGINFAGGIADPNALGERIVQAIRNGELVLKPGQGPSAEPGFGAPAIHSLRGVGDPLDASAFTSPAVASLDVSAQALVSALAGFDAPAGVGLHLEQHQSNVAFVQLSVAA